MTCHVCRYYQPNLFAYMIEGQHFVEKEQACVGDLNFVLGQFRQALNLPHGIVGKIAHRSGREGRQPWQTRWLVAAERPPQNSKNVVVNFDYLFAFSNGYVAPARHDSLERSEPDKGVSAHLLAAFH